MENISPVNINKICRICFIESQDIVSIYSELYKEESDTSSFLETIPFIYEVLISISSMKINVDDGLPSMICAICLDAANTTFKFQKQCNQSQAVLEEFSKQCLLSVKTEVKTDGIIDHTSSINGRKHEDFRPSDDIISININTTENVNIRLPEEEGEESSELVNILDVVPVTNTELKLENSSSDNKIYSCTYCGRNYKHANSLRVHLRNHTKESPYKCKVCGKCFTQCGSLVYHMRSHTGDQPYACKICGKRYKQSGTLTAHMRVHTGERPFLCSICGKGFRQAPDLGYHMRTHTKEKPYMCSICGKTMSMQCHLVQHMRIHTGERPFKCSVCDKAFPSTARLKRHEIIHTSLKPYSCDVCSKSFNRASSLNVHSKIHTDERSHVCPVCGKGFIQAHALKSHLLSHSSQKQ